MQRARRQWHQPWVPQLVQHDDGDVAQAVRGRRRRQHRVMERDGDVVGVQRVGGDDDVVVTQRRSAFAAHGAGERQRWLSPGVQQEVAARKCRYGPTSRRPTSTNDNAETTPRYTASADNSPSVRCTQERVD